MQFCPWMLCSGSWSVPLRGEDDNWDVSVDNRKQKGPGHKWSCGAEGLPGDMTRRNWQDWMVDQFWGMMATSDRLRKKTLKTGEE